MQGKSSQRLTCSSFWTLVDVKSFQEKVGGGFTRNGRMTIRNQHSDVSTFM